jgi:hypothetical protein
MVLHSSAAFGNNHAVPQLTTCTPHTRTPSSHPTRVAKHPRLQPPCKQTKREHAGHMGWGDTLSALCGESVHVHMSRRDTAMSRNSSFVKTEEQCHCSMKVVRHGGPQGTIGGWCTSEMKTMQRCWECGVRRGICPVYLVGFARSVGVRGVQSVGLLNSLKCVKKGCKTSSRADHSFECR